MAISDDKLSRLEIRYESMQHQLNTQPPGQDAYVKLSREFAEFTPVYEGVQKLKKARSEAADLGELIAAPDTDAEMREMAKAEFAELVAAIPLIERELQFLLLPADEADQKNAILELRAGIGGDEAALFAADLFAMYRRYAEEHDWKFEVMHMAENDLGGLKDAAATITGRGVFARLKFESGVHRVQRVPATEASGRIHTSAATVAVLPEAEEVDIKIEDKDLRIDVFRSSGPGGQSVNTTDSAVRITHIPTGLVVQQQDEKSQHKNKAKAMKVLRSRLYDQERAQRDAARSAQRKSQVGSGDRSERIRTYNFPQNRVTDHRVNLTLHKLDRVITGEALDEIIEVLIAEDQAERLASLGDEAA